MSTFDSKDLPAIVHYLQVLVLACDIEAEHEARYQQTMSPDNARIQAMEWNVRPPSTKEQQMIKDSFRVAIRIWKAHRELGIRWNDNIHIEAQDLVMVGLK